jgi:hypothetical protein
MMKISKILREKNLRIRAMNLVYNVVEISLDALKFGVLASVAAVQVLFTK